MHAVYVGLKCFGTFPGRDKAEKFAQRFCEDNMNKYDDNGNPTGEKSAYTVIVKGNGGCSIIGEAYLSPSQVSIK